MDGETTTINWIVALVQMAAAALVSWLGLCWESRAVAKAEKIPSHWTQRARAAWPARVTASLQIFLIPTTLMAIRAQTGLAENATLPWWCEGIAAMIGTMLGTFPFEQKLFPELTFLSWTHHVVAGWGVRLMTTWVFVICIDAMPMEWSWSGLQSLGGYLAFHVFCQYGGVMGFLRAVRFVVPADSALTEQASRIAERAGIRLRRVWVMEGVTANAMALILTRELMFSRRLLRICTREEVDAVCGHEVGHLTESKWVVAGRVLTGLAWTPFLFIKPAMTQHGFTGLFGLCILLMLISKAGRALSIAMEHRADQAAAGGQLSEGVYASALEKIHEASLIPAVLQNKGTTHPHLYDRMLKAGVIPNYERPAPPSKHTLWRWIITLAFGYFSGPYILEIIRMHS